MQILKHLFVLVLSLAGTMIAHAQMLPVAPECTPEDSLGESRRVHIIQLDYEQGGILKHGSGDTLAVDFLKKCRYQEIGLRLGWQSNRNSHYASMYNFPMYGVGISAATYNHSQLGNPITAYGFLALPLFPRSKKFNINVDFASGIGLNFNPYTRDANSGNLVIGSKINAYVAMGAKLNYALTPRLTLGLAYGFRHYSNGGTQKPNLGVNMAPLQASVAYVLENRLPDLRRFKKVVFGKSRSILDFNFAAGPKQVELHGKRYFKSTVGLYYFWQPGFKTRWGAGIDYFYSSCGTDRVMGSETDFQKSSSIAAVPSFEWIVTRNLYLNIGLGFYAYQHKENDESQVFYERVSMRYRLYEHFNLGFGIKAHLGVADIFEYSIGYSIPSRKVRI